MKYLLTITIPIIFLIGCIISTQTAEASGCGYVRYTPAYSSYALTWTYWPAHSYNGYAYPAGDYAYYNGYYLFRSTTYSSRETTSSYTAPTPPAYGANWKVEMAKFLKEREDQAAYLQTLAAVGYVAPFGSNMFGPATFNAGSYMGNGTGYSGIGYGAKGTYANTQYGYGLAQFGSQYTVNSTAAAYGTTDMNVLYQQSNRLADRLISGATDLTRNHQELVALTGEQAARIAEFNAKAGLVRELARAANIAPSVKTTTTATGAAAGTGTLPPAPGTVGAEGGRTPEGAVPAMPPAGEDVRVAVPNPVVAFSACMSCHSGKNIKAGLDLGNPAGLSDEQIDSIMVRISTKDEKRRMPLAADEKSPGIPLPKAKKQYIRDYLRSIGK